MPLQNDIAAPSCRQQEFSVLLSEPGLLDMPTLLAWLHWELRQRFPSTEGGPVSLVVHRATPLDGVCAALGVGAQAGEVALDEAFVPREVSGSA
jgi:hypothetical protein